MRGGDCCRIQCRVWGPNQHHRPRLAAGCISAQTPSMWAARHLATPPQRSASRGHGCALWLHASTAVPACLSSLPRPTLPQHHPPRPCSCPPILCTSQFLACNRQRYLVGDEEQVLIQGKCASGVSLSSAAVPAAAAGLRLAAALGGLLGAALLLL